MIIQKMNRLLWKPTYEFNGNDSFIFFKYIDLIYSLTILIHSNKIISTILFYATVAYCLKSITKLMKELWYTTCLILFML